MKSFDDIRKFNPYLCCHKMKRAKLSPGRLQVLFPAIAVYQHYRRKNNILPVQWQASFQNTKLNRF